MSILFYHNYSPIIIIIIVLLTECRYTLCYNYCYSWCIVIVCVSAVQSYSLSGHKVGECCIKEQWWAGKIIRYICVTTLFPIIQTLQLSSAQFFKWVASSRIIVPNWHSTGTSTDRSNRMITSCSYEVVSPFCIAVISLSNYFTCSIKQYNINNNNNNNIIIIIIITII